MQITEFVERLKNTPRDWRLEHGMIRRGSGKPDNLDDRQCPIIALVHGGMRDSITSAANTLGLSFQDFQDILDAADNGTGGNRNERVKLIRQQLLEACGLQEG